MRLVTFMAASGGARVGELKPDHTVVELSAPTMIDWLAGDGQAPSGPTYRLADVSLLAPVPQPPSVRDFYAYEGHVAAGFRARGATIPPAWYEMPVFYFSNPGAIYGPGAPITRPEGVERLDFELEIAAVIGADDRIAGFTLMNDWSARDIQLREMTVGLGPAKGKDFATSLGPWLVTPDELAYDGEWLHLHATVTVNDRPVTRADTEPMHYSWPELVAQAARGTRLRPGDVLGSGTLTGGCLLELGPIDGHWIEPGDTVALWAEGLGELRTEVM
ncbi:MAG TPA: fumarylacetoacetate hydrolase family protein [Solirubrobacteraceae bacterium]|nr:fumarylacetoacetate hydrolase family protein [Solirubrobacteraceae bacterium]